MRDIITKLIHLLTFRAFFLGIGSFYSSVEILVDTCDVNDWGLIFSLLLTSDRHVEYVLLGSSVFDGECSEISMKTNRENI